MRRLPIHHSLSGAALLALTAIGVIAPLATTGANGDICVPRFAELDLTSFDRSTVIDNEWLPLRPGMQSVYEGHTVEDGERVPHRIEFTVTDLTKRIGGVRNVVAWVVDISDGEVVETELSFYAQDNDGRVWYFGEYPEEYDDGKFVAASSWLHGLEHARAGVKVVASPRPGMPVYFQGWGPAVGWTDYGRVAEPGGEICVTAGCFRDLLAIDESSLGEPGAYQIKILARGVGEVKVEWRGDDKSQETLELVERKLLDADALAAIRADALAQEMRAYARSPDLYGKTAPAE